MPDSRAPAAVFSGPWRAVPVLGLVQIFAWGAMVFHAVLTVPEAVAERGWSGTLGMAGFSTALFVAGFASPRAGAAIDRYGGHVVMPIGCLLGSAGFVLLVVFDSPLSWFAGWAVIGLGMAASLYDAAFAAMGRIFGTAARRPITWLAIVTGFATSLTWPATHVLIQVVGWRGTYLIFAAVLAFATAPLARFGLPRTQAAHERPAGGGGAKSSARVLPAQGLPFLLVASGFACYAFTHAGMGAHLLVMFSRMGLDPGTAVALGAIAGPVQVGSRVLEMAFGRGVHALWLARLAVTLLLAAFALLAVLGISKASVAAFFVLFGAANGIFTIARGALPLALFGAAGYGRVMGRIALPYLMAQSVAPIALAFVIERASDPAALGVVAAFMAASLACLALVRRP